MHRRHYENYDAYLGHQREKTEKPALRKKLADRFDADVARFTKEFAALDKRTDPGSDAICLGSRLGAEVQTLRNMGHKAIGIDLVPCPPLVIAGDFHDIPFVGDSFDIVYTNSIDHVFDVAKFAAEIRRVLKPNGWLQVQIAPQMFGKFESIRIDSEQEFLDLFPGFRIIHRSDNGREPPSLRIWLLLERKGQK